MAGLTCPAVWVRLINQLIKPGVAVKLALQLEVKLGDNHLGGGENCCLRQVPPVAGVLFRELDVYVDNEFAILQSHRALGADNLQRAGIIYALVFTGQLHKVVELRPLHRPDDADDNARLNAMLTTIADYTAEQFLLWLNPEYMHLFEQYKPPLMLAACIISVGDDIEKRGEAPLRVP